MDLLEDILRFKPKIKTDFIYYRRDEKFGFSSIRFNGISGGELLLNKSYIDILDLLNGNNSINDIIEALCKKYKSAKREIVKNDVINVINKLLAMRGLEWKGINPFIKDYKNKYNDFDIYLSNYSENDKIINFLKSTILKENAFKYIDPLICNEDIFDLNFINNNYIINISKNNSLIGSVAFKNNTKLGKEISYIIIDCFKDNIDKFILEAIKVINNVNEFTNKWISIDLINNTNFELVKIIENIGFKSKFIMKNELGYGIDLNEFILKIDEN